MLFDGAELQLSSLDFF
uniref:Uncharacterized protein n=1 Tax=Rhizophora mucronata TaxID=61149 RepID=A0A2P2P656_RHIMU